MESIDLDMEDLFETEQDLDEDIAMPPPMPDLDDDDQPMVSGHLEDGEEQGEEADVLSKLHELKKGAAKKRVTRPQPKLDPTRLTSDRGIPLLPSMFDDVKFRGKGHEAHDLKVMMQKYEHWAHRLFPKMTFDDVIERIERLGKKSAVQTCVKRIRLDMPIVDDDFVTNVEDGEKKEERGVDQDAEEALDEMMRDDDDDDEDPIAAAQRRVFPPHSPPSSPSAVELDDVIITPAPPSPPTPKSFLSADQMERMERNKRLAMEKRAARMKNSPAGVKLQVSASQNQTKESHAPTPSGSAQENHTPVPSSISQKHQTYNPQENHTETSPGSSQENHSSTPSSGSQENHTQPPSSSSKYVTPVPSSNLPLDISKTSLIVEKTNELSSTLENVLNAAQLLGSEEQSWHLSGLSITDRSTTPSAQSLQHTTTMTTLDNEVTSVPIQDSLSDRTCNTSNTIPRPITSTAPPSDDNKHQQTKTKNNEIATVTKPDTKSECKILPGDDKHASKFSADTDEFSKQIAVLDRLPATFNSIDEVSEQIPVLDHLPYTSENTADVNTENSEVIPVIDRLSRSNEATSKSQTVASSNNEDMVSMKTDTES